MLLLRSFLPIHTSSLFSPCFPRQLHFQVLRYQIGQPGSLVLFVAPYLAACIFFAMTTSIAIRNRETCMLIFVFTSVPLLFISGISWPGAAIPPFWKYVSYIFPSTFGINGFVKINNMGATLSEVAFEYKALWIQAGVYFLTTCWVYRWQILMSRKHAIERYNIPLPGLS